MASLKLYDMLGKAMLVRDIYDRSEIDISYLLKGLYFVKVYEVKVVGNCKIV